MYGTTGTSRFDAKEEIQVVGHYKDESTDAKHWGGAIRSSDEVTVMVMERRGCIKQYIYILN